MGGLLTWTPLGWLVLGTLSGCSALGVADSGYLIERTNSRSAEIRGVWVDKTSKGLEISGTVARRWSRRGHIRGHVDIYFVDAGVVLTLAEGVRYRRSSRKARSANFRVSINSLVPQGGVIRVAHHDAGPEHSPKSDNTERS